MGCHRVELFPVVVLLYPRLSENGAYDDLIISLSR